jgi:DNA repair exonuclease SbcCD ATPase subunit
MVIPIPEVPEAGLLNSVRYAITFERARWQRRGAIKRLGDEIKLDTASLDLVLGSLGHQARELGVESRAIAGENAAITAAHERKNKLDQANAELVSRKTDETSKFAEVERDRQAKVSDAERILEDASRELASYEGQRRSLREKRKEVERRQKAYVKAAEDRENEAGTAPMGDMRAELRRAAEGHRKEAATLDPERQELDRKLSALDRPLGQAQAKVDAARADLESARRSLHDAREGYRHRVAEIEAEQGRKTREVAQADSEIQRRLVTLGTLINLNRIEHPGFAELYERIDRLRMAIGARTTEIDKLTAEREAYDRGSRVRGFVTLAGGVVVLITLLAILLAVV